jgi:hypothetical protein
MNETTTQAVCNFQATMNAVIISDDLSFAGKVHSLLDEAGDQAKKTARWRVSSWRLDQLMSPPSENSVLNDTGEAHLIVLAVRGQKELPLRLVKWMEIWAEHRKEVDSVRMTFGSGGGGAFSTQGAVELSQNTENQKLSLSSGVAISAGGGAGGFVGNPNVPSKIRAPRTISNLKPAYFESYRDWGLNE